MSYRLQKPYTEDDFSEFIIEHNHRHSRRIEETSDYVFALEPNEIIQDGEPIIDPHWEEKEQERIRNEQIEEINAKIKELEQMAVSEILYGNTNNVLIYQDVINGLIDTRNNL